MSSLLRKEFRTEAVYICHSVKEGLQVAWRKAPDLIILDWEIPGMDGLALLDSLRRTTTPPPYILLMYSESQTTSWELRSALKGGATELLRKPIVPIELLTRVDSLRRFSRDAYRPLNGRAMGEGLGARFLASLVADHPDLTANELNFCSLLRLNLSQKETADLLSISVGAVEKRRYRLRKKLGLGPDIKLEHYIHGLHNRIARPEMKQIS